MQDKLIKLCGLYENTSKAGKKYFSGSLSYSSKILIFQEQDAPEGQPGWSMYLSEREPKPRTAGDTGGLKADDIPASDFPPRRSTATGGSMRWMRKAT